MLDLEEIERQHAKAYELRDRYSNDGNRTLAEPERVQRLGYAHEAVPKLLEEVKRLRQTIQNIDYTFGNTGSRTTQEVLDSAWEAVEEHGSLMMVARLSAKVMANTSSTADQVALRAELAEVLKATK